MGSGPVVTTTITYYYLNGQRVAQAKDGVFTWIHVDHLSSATRITDVNGLEIRRLAYASFGEEAENQGTGDEPKYKYTGKEHDATGLYYYGARYYDSALSRFITADTVYDRGPQGLNRYSYALNNPIIYRDPTGHFISGPDDDPNPTAYGNVTGSQEQFAEETATIHDGDDGTSNMTIDEYIASRPPFKSEKTATIVLDPGHGDVYNKFLDGGTENTKTGKVEKDLVLTLSKAVGAELQKQGHEIILTREGDIHKKQKRWRWRTDISNQENADVFISVHIDSYDAKKNYFKVFYSSKKGKILADSIESSVNQKGFDESKSVENKKYKVLKWTKAPAVIIEAGNIQNTQNEKIITNPRFINQVVTGINKGIEELFKPK